MVGSWMDLVLLIKTVTGGKTKSSALTITVPFWCSLKSPEKGISPEELQTRLALK